MNKKTTYKVGSVFAVAAVLLSPVIAAAETDTTSVSATVASVISVNSAATVAMNVTPTSEGAVASATDNVTVSSNDPDGYDLTLENDTTMTMAGPSGATLAKTAGTYGTPAALSTNSWGYRLDTFAADAYAGVEDVAQNIKTTTATANNEPTAVTYGVKVDTSIPAGVYTDSVTYTATAK